MSSIVIALSVLVAYVQFSSCRQRPLAYWSRDARKNKQLINMAYFEELDQIYIGGINNVYHLEGRSLEVLNKDITGPFNDTINDVITVLHLNKTGSGTTFLSTCSSTQPYWVMRNISDVSIIHEYMSQPILSSNASVLTVVQPQTRPKRQIEFTFIACPHSDLPRASSDKCREPGIKWLGFDTHRKKQLEDEIQFDPYKDTTIVTEKYIASLALGHYRLFFSTQRDKDTGRIYSRVAQLCHNQHPELTYADMIIECGPYTVLTDVVIHELENDTLIITTFSDGLGHGSAICVFRYSDVKTRLVENIKLCYSGSKVEDKYDYILGQENRCPPGPALNKPEYFFLCNDYKLLTRFSVIGQLSLISEPVLRYQGLGLTAVSVTMVASKLVAFLGTTLGDVRKAVVFPAQSAGKLIFTVMIAYREPINPDMFIDRDKENVFAMTSFKVAKIPVQICNDYLGCSKCLSSKDPHCGWCFLDHRCSESASCNSTWIPASTSNASCPYIKISPSVVPVSGSQELTIGMPIPLTEIQDVYCVFSKDDKYHDNVLLGNTTATALNSNGTTLFCLTPDFILSSLTINGSAVLRVAITSKLSSNELVYGNFTIYSCQTFRSCSACTKTTWSCNWCVYDNICVMEGQSCNIATDKHVNQSYCPSVIKAEEKPTFMDNKKIFYLPVHDSIDIVIKGRNLIEPRHGLEYSCHLPGAANQTFLANRKNTGQIVCRMNKAYYRLNSERMASRLQLKWGSTVIDGNEIKVVVYNCPDLIQEHYDCDGCKSFSVYQPFYRCQWCNNQCLYSQPPCQVSLETQTCPEPSILKVFPLKIHTNSNTRLDITGVNLGSTFDETVGSVVIGNQTCVSQQDFFIPSKRISCKLEAPGVSSSASLNITIRQRKSVIYNDRILFKTPTIMRIHPNIGPLSGGTEVDIIGEDLDVGRRHGALIGNFSCTFVSISSKKMVIKTTSSGGRKLSADVSMVFDDIIQRVENVTFRYVDDPVIELIYPRKSFNSGGRLLTVSGSNLMSIQKPKLFIGNPFTGRTSNLEFCTRDEEKKMIYCPTPRYPVPFGNSSSILQRRKREMGSPGEDTWLIQFKMDDVKSVQELPENFASIMYYEDPTVYQFKQGETFSKVLIIKGERMGLAASQSDIRVKTGEENCNITKFSNETIQCVPPSDKPSSNQTSGYTVPVVVHIGYLSYSVGELDYGPDIHVHPREEERAKEYIIAGTVVGVLLLVVAVLVIVLYVTTKKKKNTARENKKLTYQMENLEASVSKQCREEFAALQTTVSDLTEELEGGSILFRDYDVYASKVLFADSSHPVLAPPVIMNDNMVPGLETLKGLLKNKEFLILLIKTLEQQEAFTIQDRSNFASLLMAINGDNMEFITDVMKSLLNELIDKTVATQRTKLLLRRSECVVEKLVTHWLSICLYHYLKERTGTALFILYKAIKVQVEKGPLDYITGCAKYTLSEAKLFTAGDAEISTKPLGLHVHHCDYKADKEHNITVEVLECDTVSQTKSKILDVLYNNVPLSQRPLVHGTLLELHESDGTKRMLHDEDASNEKAGIWKRLNTLQHYNIEDGSKVELTVSREEDLFDVSASPESFIVGSIKRSKPVMRTISGSNFWHLVGAISKHLHMAAHTLLVLTAYAQKPHLKAHAYVTSGARGLQADKRRGIKTKQHKSEEDEMKLSSDLFLPRLINTKGALQKFIDDLFVEMFKVDEEPPLIIKYLFDFLDGAAARHKITDPDVLHTWKCNSLLLRFWVNLVKNPEFVFDIHKPHIVDSCLSVITQTLMDSCSTAALRLGKDSPSNKLLFAKDIPRYKDMVKNFFQEIHDKPSYSDQDLNCYLTEKVSQKFGDRLYVSSALFEMYKYVAKFKDKILPAFISMEIPIDATSEQNRDTPLLLKLQQVYSTMEACNTSRSSGQQSSLLTYL